MADKRTTPPAPEMDSEVASRLRDPFEPVFMGVIRPNDPLLGEHGNNWQLYRDLKRDGKVYAGLQKRILALIGRPWTVQPIDDVSTADAEAVQNILEGFNFDRLCADLMEALIVGFAPAEVVWTRRDNLVVPARVVKRAQRRFVYVQDEDGRPPQLRLLTREEMIRGVELPERKFLVHRVNPEDDNPYGTGLGLQLYWPVFFKRKGIIAWNKLNDRFGTPTPWGKYPRNASKKEKDTLFAALKAFSNDGVVMTPEGTMIELLESKLTGSVSTQESLCNYMDDWISEVILGQEPRQKGGGALAAASKEREGVRLELTQADSDLLSETLNDTLIRWICEYNGLAPCAVYRDISAEEDKKAESETDKNVAEMGFELSEDAVRTKYGEGWTRRKIDPPPDGEKEVVDGEDVERAHGDGQKYDASMLNAYAMGLERLAKLGVEIPLNFPSEIFDIPKPKSGEALLVPRAPEAPGDSAQFAEATADPPEKVADTLSQAGADTLGGWIEQIRKLVADSPDLPTLQARLVDEFNALPHDQLAEVMALGYTTARLAGMVKVAEGQ